MRTLAFVLFGEQAAGNTHRETVVPALTDPLRRQAFTHTHTHSISHTHNRPRWTLTTLSFSKSTACCRPPRRWRRVSPTCSRCRRQWPMRPSTVRQRVPMQHAVLVHQCLRRHRRRRPPRRSLTTLRRPNATRKRLRKRHACASAIVHCCRQTLCCLKRRSARSTTTGETRRAAQHCIGRRWPVVSV